MADKRKCVPQKPLSAKTELQSAIKKLGLRLGVNSVFTKFLELTATSIGAVVDPFNAEERNRQYEDALKGLTHEDVSELARMAALMYLAVKEYEDNPQDILGDIYHNLQLNNEWNGQFFTPDNICRMMAMLLNSDVSEDISNEHITISEPACGSGTMVIGAIWAMMQKGVDYQRKSLFIAQDIDIRCVWMAYIQLTLYKIPAIVIHGNTLTNEAWSRWYTPYAIPFLIKKSSEEAAV